MCGAMWDVEWCTRLTLLFHVPQIFQRSKSDANKQDFLIKLDLTFQARSTSKIIEISTNVFCTPAPNLVILAWTGDELSHGQAQNEVNFDFEVKFIPWRSRSITPKTIGILIKVFYTHGPNLVILAWTGDELSHGQAGGWRTHTDTHTDRRRQRQNLKAETGLG